MNASLGLRKGAWTDEEDALLRNCIERHGEGRWHLVPRRAGLNRCRKSCRLRWLNYLKPNIKRGEFEDDEVDLIVRLHNLLGNKWSLIAGRIPGRTANDVKNYWNTRLARKITSGKKESKPESQKIIKVKVIKPHPRTFSKGSTWLSGRATLITCESLRPDHGNTNTNIVNDSTTAGTRTSPPLETVQPWWEGLCDDDAQVFDPTPAFASLPGEVPDCELFTGTATRGVENSGVDVDERGDISFNIDIWQLLDQTPQAVA